MDLETLLRLAIDLAVHWLGSPSFKESEMNDSYWWFLWHSTSLMLHTIDITEMDSIAIELSWEKIKTKG